MTYSQKYHWRALCNESLDHLENYKQALAENFKGWCIHHRREIQPDGTRVSMQELIDKGLYYDRPANELIFMRFREHSSLHSAGNKFLLGYHHSEDSRLKIAEAHRGKHHSAETLRKISESSKGKHHTEETRWKIAEANKGKHLWNNGILSIRSRECPGEGWTRGLLRCK